jgi:hypothetical protein
MNVRASDTSVVLFTTVATDPRKLAMASFLEWSRNENIR